MAFLQSFNLSVVFTFEGGGHGFGGAEGLAVRVGALASVADGLYSEGVAAGLGQPLDLVGVTGAPVDAHEPDRVGGVGGSC